MCASQAPDVRVKGRFEQRCPHPHHREPAPVPARGSFSCAQEKGPIQDSGKKSDVCRMQFLVCVLGGYRQDHRDIHWPARGVEPANTLEGAGFVSKIAPPGVSGQPQERRRPALVAGALGAHVISCAPRPSVAPLPCLRRRSHPKCK